MRVAVISRGSPDYLIDIVTDGLVRVLGRASVAIEFNRRALANPKKRHLYSHAASPNSFGIYEADALVTSIRGSAADTSEWIKRTGKGRVAVLDGADRGGLKADLLAMATVYFRREFLRGASYPPKVKPLPFGAVPEPLKKGGDRTIPVFWRAKPTNPIRGEVFRELKKAEITIQEELLPKEEFNVGLQSSLIGVSARGAGWDTYRYWETPYMGALLLSQELEIVIPGNFKPGVEAVFWSSPPEMVGKVKRLLSDRKRLDAVAMAGRNATVQRHLSTHRARSVLEALA